MRSEIVRATETEWTTNPDAAKGAPTVSGRLVDGQAELTLVVKDGNNEATLKLNDRDREVLGLEGVSPFLPWTAGPAGGNR